MYDHIEKDKNDYIRRYWCDLCLKDGRKMVKVHMERIDSVHLVL